jgi:hypothetical protein
MGRQDRFPSHDTENLDGRRLPLALCSTEKRQHLAMRRVIPNLDHSESLCLPDGKSTPMSVENRRRWWLRLHQMGVRRSLFKNH